MYCTFLTNYSVMELTCTHLDCKSANLMIAQCGMIHSAYNMCNGGSLVCNRYIDASDYVLQKVC